MPYLSKPPHRDRKQTTQTKGNKSESCNTSLPKQTSSLYSYCQQRRYPAEDLLVRYPMTPWICPPLHPRLRAIFENWGEARVLKRGEPLVPFGKPCSQVCIVKQGIVGRHIGYSPVKVSAEPMLISLPMNYASGNLNLHTRYPVHERCTALSKTTLLVLEQDFFLDILKSDATLMELFEFQQERNSLCDRLAFCCHCTQSTKIKLQMFLYSWSVIFGERIEQDFILLPKLLTRRIAADVVNCTLGWLDNILHEWKDSGIFRSHHGRFCVHLSAISLANRYIRNMEETHVGFQRLDSLDVYFPD